MRVLCKFCDFYVKDYDLVDGAYTFTNFYEDCCLCIKCFKNLVKQQIIIKKENNKYECMSEFFNKLIQTSENDIKELQEQYNNRLKKNKKILRDTEKRLNHRLLKA